MTKDKGIFLEKMIIFILLVATITCFLTNTYYEKISAIMLLILNIYLIIKCRKNKALFLIFIILFYFNYSFIISKYIGSGTSNLELVYSQIQFSNTKGIGVTSVLLFFLVVAFFLNKTKKFEKEQINQSYICKDNKNHDGLLFGLTVILTVIIFGYLVLKLSISRQIYEYSLIFFIFGFYYSKNNKGYKILLTILMLISTFINMKNGGRIISLQPIMAWGIIYYYDKLTYKNIFIALLLGILVFTVAGLYGDFLAYGMDLGQLNLEYIRETFEKRKFALDTSISAYWTGLTFIEMTSIVDLPERIANFAQYMTTYTLLGGKSGYIQLTDLSLDYYTHYNGGFLTSYFYFWLGVPGVIIIGIYISKFLNSINKINNETKDLQKIIGVFFIATISRWYLYFPTILIRELLILVVLYIIINKILRISDKKRNKEEIEINAE